MKICEVIAPGRTGHDRFWSWFNGSKIVDKTGDPIGCYHGTGHQFDRFRVSDKGWTQGTIWFSLSPTIASGYAGGKYEFDINPGGNVRPCFLRVVRPYVIDAKGKYWNEIHSKKIAKYYDQAGHIDDELFTTDDIARYAKDTNHDGVIIRNVVDPSLGGHHVPSTVVAVFRQDQVAGAFTLDTEREHGQMELDL